MNNQDKHFWSQFPEEELKDPATRQVLAALDKFYRSDAADQESVQRAWERVSLNMEQKEREKIFLHRSAFDSSPGSFSPIEVRSAFYRKKSRSNTLVALLVTLFLIGSMIGVISYVKGTNNTITGSHSSTPGVYSPVPLGTSLGQLHLGMTLRDLAKMGIPVVQDPEPSGSDTFQCSSCGFAILGPNGAFQLIVWSPFQGKTREGLGVGMSFAQFQALYQHYETEPEPKTFDFHTAFNVTMHYDFNATVRDTHGTYLIAFFKQQKVVAMMLQNQPPL